MSPQVGQGNPVTALNGQVTGLLSPSGSAAVAMPRQTSSAATASADRGTGQAAAPRTNESFTGSAVLAAEGSEERSHPDDEDHPDESEGGQDQYEGIRATKDLLERVREKLTPEYT